MSKRKHKKTITVDFDGVLHSYDSGWKGVDVIPDPPVKGAMDWLYDIAVLYQNMFIVTIYSSRSSRPEGLKAMQEWLEKHARNELGSGAAKRLLELIVWPEVKPPSHLSLDDRAVTFTGPDSFPTPEFCECFAPWNRRD